MIHFGKSLWSNRSLRVTRAGTPSSAIAVRVINPARLRSELDVPAHLLT